MKRRAIYQVSTELFIRVLNGKEAFVLPDDAVILRLDVDHLRNYVEILVTSETYDEVPEGVYPPTRHDLMVRTLVGSL